MSNVACCTIAFLNKASFGLKEVFFRGFFFFKKKEAPLFLGRVPFIYSTCFRTGLFSFETVPSQKCHCRNKVAAFENLPLSICFTY